MLVLSRKKNESIIINDDITVIVVDIMGDKVRLGVEAPGEIPVHRQEVYQAIKRENQHAAGLGGSSSPDSKKSYLPRVYETLLMPGDSIEHSYMHRLERLIERNLR